MTPSLNPRTIARGLLRLRRQRMLPQCPSTSQKSLSHSGENKTDLLRSPLLLPNPETRSSMKGHRIQSSGFKKGISGTVTRRTVDRAAATQPIIDLLTHTQAKGAAASSEAIHMNLRTIENGSQVVRNGLPTSPLAEIMTGHGLHLRIDPVRPPPSTAYRHARTSPRMTCGGRLGIGVETIILVTNLVTDTTVQTTCHRTVTTALKEIHGGRLMITDRGLLPPLRLDPLEWIILHLLLAFPMMHRTASTPLRRHPQTHLLHPLQNDPCLWSTSRYPSLFLPKNQSLPSSADPLRRSILFSPPILSQRLNQAPPISSLHHR